MDTRAFDAGVVLSALPQLLEFLDITLLVGISSIVLGSLLGGALAWAKLSQHKILNYLAQLYIYIMRCTPSIVMLFIVFYGLPALVEAVFEENIHDMDRAVFALLPLPCSLVPMYRKFFGLPTRLYLMDSMKRLYPLVFLPGVPFGILCCLRQRYWLCQILAIPLSTC